jgi:hypothetical protein
LLLRSEEFDNAAWTKTRSSITSNTIVAPDGTLTGDKLVEDTTASNTHQVSQPASLTAGTHTYSIFAKAGERSVLQTFRSNLNIDLFTHTFNLSTGTASGTGASIVSVGNSWYLCISTVTVNATGSTGINFSINNGSTNSYTGDGTSGIYLWGAQLEQSTTVGEYIPTTSTINSAPRFDHDPTTGESLGLLVEESRQNLLLQSEDFSTTWLPTGLLAFGSGSTVNAIASPDGQITADLLTESTSTGAHQVAQTFNVTTGTAYTLSVFAKAASSPRRLTLLVSNTNFGVTPNAVFDLSAGTNISTLNGTATITPFRDGWYRVTLTTITATGTGANALSFRLTDNTNAFSYTGDGTSGIYLWGAQLEAGSFPTSYIPTTGAAATRAADVASISGSNFSSWYRQDSGSWYCSATSLVFDSNERGLFGIDTGSFARGYHAATSSPTRIRTRRRDATNTIATDATLSAGTSARVALVATSTEQATTYNGGAVITNATALTLDPITDLRIGYQNITGSPANLYLCGCLSRLTYWPQRLPNETLQTITV